MLSIRTPDATGATGLEALGRQRWRLRQHRFERGFIFGHLGIPALGLIGAGWATLMTRTVMLAVLTAVVYRTHFSRFN